MKKLFLLFLFFFYHNSCYSCFSLLDWFKYFYWRKLSQETKDKLLSKAVEEKNYSKALTLLKAGADAKKRDEGGKTLLMIAAQNRSLPLMKLLKKYGNKLVDVDDLSRSSLMYAARGGSEEVIDWLFKKKVPVHKYSKNRFTPLMYAAMYGNCSVVERLLAYRSESGQSKIDLEAENKFGQTAFLCAVKNDREKCAKILFKQGADIQKKDHEGKNCLHYIVESHGEKSLLRFLLVNGADPWGTDHHGETPLHYAAAEGCDHYIPLLLLFGGTSLILKKDNSNQTPLDWALRDWQSAVTFLLNDDEFLQGKIEKERGKIIQKFGTQSEILFQKINKRQLTG